MTIVGAYEAKTHFSQLLERVAQGERIIITRHHVPVATLQPVPPQPELTPEQVISQLRALRSRYRLQGLDVQEMKNQGRA
ncbi:MAG: type II toxin-antitoxin system prevent-host-death family antitoxin [Caldilineae bacterium]|nr:MAG: type II toxin-antitoxin system prevent-host-death family antitoxin [Caldilineae bacterium]